MTQEEFNEKLLAISPKLKPVLNVLWDNRSYALQLLRVSGNDKIILKKLLYRIPNGGFEGLVNVIHKNREAILSVFRECESGKQSVALRGCNKNAITDPHYGEAGEYDSQCNWIPWT